MAPIRIRQKPEPFTSKFQPFTRKPEPFTSKMEPFTPKSEPFILLTVANKGKTKNDLQKHISHPVRGTISGLLGGSIRRSNRPKMQISAAVVKS
jgi:hypothetical protein